MMYNTSEPKLEKDDDDIGLCHIRITDVVGHLYLANEKLIQKSRSSVRLRRHHKRRNCEGKWTSMEEEGKDAHLFSM